MADLSKLSGGMAPVQANEARFAVSVADAGLSVDVGTPVTPDPGGSDTTGIIYARANAAGTANVIGLAATAGEAPGFINARMAGPLTLTTEQWDRVTGQSGGLTIGAPYFLSAATAGMLTTTAPSAGGQFQTPVGFALSPTTMMVQIGLATPNS